MVESVSPLSHLKFLQWLQIKNTTISPTQVFLVKILLISDCYKFIVFHAKTSYSHTHFLGRVSVFSHSRCISHRIIKPCGHRCNRFSLFLGAPAVPRILHAPLLCVSQVEDVCLCFIIQFSPHDAEKCPVSKVRILQVFQHVAASVYKIAAVKKDPVAGIDLNPRRCRILFICCVLRRPVATSAFASGHPALPVAGVNQPLFVQS